MYVIGKYRVSAYGLNWIAASDETVRISFDLIPQDALNYLKEKAFWISGISNQDFLNEVQTALESVMKDGKTYRDFTADIKNIISRLGYDGDSPFRMETIFRTNIFTAYTIGQLSQVDQVKDRFPKWRYVAIIDHRTRPLHRELNGKVFNYGEGPIPPIDFGCRCSPQFIHILDDDVEAEVLSDTGLGKMLKDENVMRFDNRKDFEKYRDKKVVSMDPGIKEQVLSNL